MHIQKMQANASVVSGPAMLPGMKNRTPPDRVCCALLGAMPNAVLSRLPQAVNLQPLSTALPCDGALTLRFTPKKALGTTPAVLGSFSSGLRPAVEEQVSSHVHLSSNIKRQGHSCNP
jgi:hypothetical protein